LKNVKSKNVLESLPQINSSYRLLNFKNRLLLVQMPSWGGILENWKLACVEGGPSWGGIIKYRNAQLEQWLA
jgi:hypothetical protein